MRHHRTRIHNHLVQATTGHPHYNAPSAPAGARTFRPGPGWPIASAAADVFVNEWDRDTPGIAIPRPEIQVVVRFGPSAQRGLDIHAFGARERVHRKLLRAGQRTVSARLALGTPEAVLGAPASAMAGRIVALDDLWDGSSARRLYDQLASARDTVAAAAVLERALAERLAIAVRQSVRVELAVRAAQRLASAKVNSVAADLEVSERHLRRVFRETIGMSPKAFARFTRFQRALRAASDGAHANWASIAVATGYYDQAHLVAEFRTIAGVTPRAFLGELRAGASIG